MSLKYFGFFRTQNLTEFLKKSVQGKRSLTMNTLCFTQPQLKGVTLIFMKATIHSIRV